MNTIIDTTRKPNAAVRFKAAIIATIGAVFVALAVLGASGAKAQSLSDETNALLMNIQLEISMNDAFFFDAPPADKHGLSETLCLAVANYHEARGEGILGQVAVSSVILQRKAVGRWGETACDIVNKNNFSFMTSDYDFPPITEEGPWILALAIAQSMISHGPIVELSKVDHYHADYVSPDWSTKMTEVTKIGAHIFYADPISATWKRPS